MKQPCTQDCQNRTVSCKFDGTCDKYQEWKTAHLKGYVSNFVPKPSHRPSLQAVSGGRTHK